MSLWAPLVPSPLSELGVMLAHPLLLGAPLTALPLSRTLLVALEVWRRLATRISLLAVPLGVSPLSPWVVACRLASLFVSFLLAPHFSPCGAPPGPSPLGLWVDVGRLAPLPTGHL